MCVYVCVCARVCACVREREKVTVEIQIHEHSANVSLWTFFSQLFCPLCEHRRSDLLKKIQLSSMSRSI